MTHSLIQNLHPNPINTDSSVMESLFNNGNYPHILQAIFLSLDGNSLTSASSVCSYWRKFISYYIWNEPIFITKLSLFWSVYLPNFVIKFHRHKVITAKCNSNVIICGEEETGIVAVYQRMDLLKLKNNRKLEQVKVNFILIFMNHKNFMDLK